ncbi:FAD-binding oxidoreductase [Actinosynnema sp. NPDC020468]|uniref:FAD-binding oxidoreductase n=1 Tax=Actinosynnema sp. NPDC020468 TaxID=3154488 RepID=UPI0033E2D831
MPDLVRPGDPRYDLSRSQFIGRPHEVLPSLIARCATARDVVEALDRAAGGPFAIRGGGHDNACHSSTSGLLIDLAPCDAVEPDGDLVHVGGGVRIGRLTEVLAAQGKLVPVGSCPSVGVVGSALGGGFGADGRRHGLTCDALVAAELVVAGGRVITADDDLLWALRGGGGGHFGVVTRATFRTTPATPRTHLRLVWDFAHAADLARWWQDWAPDAPDDVSVELVLLGPEHPDEPPTALLLGTAPDRSVLAGIPSFGGPREVEVVDLTAAEAVRHNATPHAAASLDPVGIPLVSARPGMSTAKTGFFDHPLPTDVLTELLTRFTADRVRGELRELAFTPWRGAYARVPATATAFAHRAPAFLLKHTTLVGPGGAARRGHEVLARLEEDRRLVAPHGTGGVYPNFRDPDLTDWRTAYHGVNQGRLREVRRENDPTGFFTTPQQP